MFDMLGDADQPLHLLWMRHSLLLRMHIRRVHDVRPGFLSTLQVLYFSIRYCFGFVTAFIYWQLMFLFLIHTYPLDCSLLNLSHSGGRCLSTVTFALHSWTSSLICTKQSYQRALSIRTGSCQSIARTVTKKVATRAGCKYFLLDLRGDPLFRCLAFPYMSHFS